jgi:arylsulfatase A-like enzyme
VSPDLNHKPLQPGPSNTGWLLLLAGLGWGIATGFVEAAGLLVFQGLNWARWGPMMHVSKEIFWISPLVDAIFFFTLALICAVIYRFVPRFSEVRVSAFLLAFLSVYDWLTLTNRLFHRACLLLAFGAAVAFARWCGKREAAFLQFFKRATPLLVAGWGLTLAGIQGGQWLHERHAVAQLPPAASGAPNVLVIVVDTLRADHVSSYGYARPTTPNLDRIAQQGVIFENAISPSSWSLPSHVSLVTGRYLFEHGVGNVQPEPWLGWDGKGLGGFSSLGEALQQKGYRTGAFSANRTYFSRDLGFGRSFIHFEDYFDSPADMFVRTLYGREFARIYLKRSEHSLVKRTLRKLGWTSLLDQDAEGSGSYGGAFGVRKRADVVNREVMNWIGNDRARPFFAFLNYFDVHDPYGGPKTYTKPSWQQSTTIDAYDNGVKYVDDFIQRLMDELEAQDLSKNTLVVITSDHGESLGQHHLETHGRALYWELVHVPLIVYFPGHVPAGVKIETPVTNAAIPATVLQLIGADDSSMPAPSLSALWRTPMAETKAEAEWPGPLSELAQNKYPGLHDKEADQLVPTATSGAMRTIIGPKWQLISHDTLGDQLYDWQRDPGEVNDLISTPEGKAAALNLKLAMERTTKDSAKKK